jgi:hemoglobin-like flavoprotein
MPLQIDVLEESCDLIAGQSAELIDRTLSRLMELDPQFSLLFARRELAALGSVIFSLLYVFRRSLHNLDTLAPALETLGALRQDHRLSSERFGTIGIALLDAMAEVGGPAWKPAYMAAWAEAYATVWGMIVGLDDGAETAAESDSVLVA